MDDPNLLDDVRFLRDVVARTQPPAANRYWPVTLSWGCVVTAGYLICGLLGMAGRVDLLAWVWPVLIGLVALPLHWYLGRKTRLKIEESGVRPLRAQGPDVVLDRHLRNGSALDGGARNFRPAGG